MSKISRYKAGMVEGEFFNLLDADKIDIKDPVSSQIRMSVLLPRNGNDGG